MSAAAALDRLDQAIFALRAAAVVNGDLDDARHWLGVIDIALDDLGVATAPGLAELFADVDEWEASEAAALDEARDAVAAFATTTQVLSTGAAHPAFAPAPVGTHPPEGLRPTGGGPRQPSPVAGSLAPGTAAASPSGVSHPHADCRCARCDDRSDFLG